MAISFRAVEEFLTFHDPMQDRKLIDRQTEIRFDPLTGESSRIIYDSSAPFTPPDYSEQAAQTGGNKMSFLSGQYLILPHRLSPMHRLNPEESLLGELLYSQIYSPTASIMQSFASVSIITCV